MNCHSQRRIDFSRSQSGPAITDPSAFMERSAPGRIVAYPEGTQLCNAAHGDFLAKMVNPGWGLFLTGAVMGVA
jgi:hypothetical protein